MSIASLDHVAIPTDHPERLLDFYRALGFSAPSPQEWRQSGLPYFSLQFGENKINVHAPDLWRNPAFTLRGAPARPGCGDFCFVWSGTLEELRETLARAGAGIEEGPVERVGARGAGTVTGISLYTRDPDGNLLEFIAYPARDAGAPAPARPAMLTREFAERFAREWIDAWNSHDLERILSHYADDFVMASPRIAVVAGEPSGVLQGRQAVGAYWRKALALAPGLRFELVDTLVGADSIVIRYLGVRGPAAEVFFFDADGRVTRAAAHYA